MKVLLYTVFKELTVDLFVAKKTTTLRDEPSPVHSLKAEQCRQRDTSEPPALRSR
jgi:hypothetical protein